MCIRDSVSTYTYLGSRADMRYVRMWYIIPHTKTKRSRTRVHTRRLFFWDVSIRNSLRSNKNKNHFSAPGMFLCVIQHRNWPLTSTILNAHGTNASPDGLCTRTHTNEAFSCLFCCNSFRVDRARRDNVCLEDQTKACSPTDQPVRQFKDGLGINMTMKTLFTFRTD